MLMRIEGAHSLLEVGCGQGALAMYLASRYDYTGYEPDRDSFAVAERRLAKLGDGRVINAALPRDPQRAYDIVAGFEVLEHLEDDGRALADWMQWLSPGGHLLLSVPAHPHRFGPADDYVGHFRRYTRNGLRHLLESARLAEIQIETYGFPLGYALEWGRNFILGRRVRRATTRSMADRTTASGRRLQPDASAAPLTWLGTLPFRYMQRPFAQSELGTGYVARARLPTA